MRCLDNNARGRWPALAGCSQIYLTTPLVAAKRSAVIVPRPATWMGGAYGPSIASVGSTALPQMATRNAAVCARWPLVLPSLPQGPAADEDRPEVLDNRHARHQPETDLTGIRTQAAPPNPRCPKTQTLRREAQSSGTSDPGSHVRHF
jgi:hypothetical protein